MSIDPATALAASEVARGVGSAGAFLADRIMLAQGAKLHSEAAIRLLFAEAEANLDMLRVADTLLKADDKGWRDAVSLMSTEAMDLLLFNVREKTVSKKLFSELKSVISDDAENTDTVSGMSAAFFLYRKVSALKQIAALQALVPGVESQFRVRKRIENLTETTKQLRTILWKKINTFK